MSLNIQYVEGNGISDDRLQLIISLPDANAGTAMIVGSVQPAQGGSVLVNASIVLPAAPGAGSIFYNLQVDSVSGQATLQQSTVAQPPAISATSRIVFNQVMTATTLDPAYNPTSTTPDSALGSA